MFGIKEETRRSLRFNLVIVILLSVICYVLFFTSLGFITRHNDQIKVPNITGRDVKLGADAIEKLGFEVDVDSAYDPKQKAYIILSQMPEADAVVKSGRTIFLTVNRAQPPLTPMPNLLNLSFRSAEMILKSNKLILGDTTYKPDIAEGAILQQMYKGQDIRPGQMLPQGSHVDLVIGDGLGNTQFNVPEVTGLSYAEAITMLNGTGLYTNTIWEGDITDSGSAIVYDQIPRAMNELGAANRIKEGDIVDIRLKQNPAPEDFTNNRNVTEPVNDKE